MKILIRATLLLIAIILVIMAVFLFVESKNNNEEKIVFMEMVQSLSPAKENLRICLANSGDLACNKLTDFLVGKSIEGEVIYFLSEKKSIYGVNFRKNIVVHISYDEASLEWKCSGWPVKALSALCEPIAR